MFRSQNITGNVFGINNQRLDQGACVKPKYAMPYSHTFAVLGLAPLQGRLLYALHHAPYPYPTFRCPPGSTWEVYFVGQDYNDYIVAVQVRRRQFVCWSRAELCSS